MDTPRLRMVEGRIYTLDLEGGRSVYGEPIVELEGRKYREWVPWRSKLSALMKKIGPFKLPEGSVLYLGAAQGTTVSHVSDLLPDGVIFAVEVSKTAFNSLEALAGRRTNVVPVLEDAFYPERYSTMVGRVDLLYQDVSQKEQVVMFLRNADRMLKKGARGILMLKARSVDVTADPRSIYSRARSMLENGGYAVENVVDLSPFQADHAAILVRRD